MLNNIGPLKPLKFTSVYPLAILTNPEKLSLSGLPGTVPFKLPEGLRIAYLTVLSFKKLQAIKYHSVPLGL